ncbi:TPA: hypothetical protein ACGO32_002341, partial [Streptococcus suis]
HAIRENQNSPKILKVSSSLIPKQEIRLKQRNKVELTMGQVGDDKFEIIRKDSLYDSPRSLTK